MNEPQRSHRRDFLTARAAREALGRRLDEEDQAAQAEALPETYLLRIERTAMACPWEVMVNAGQYPHGPAAAMAALDEVDAVEELITVYRDTSLVAELNRFAADEPFEVPPALFGLFERSLALFEHSEGAFDITAGPLSRIWGFLARQARVPSDDELAAARATVGSQWVTLDAATGCVRFEREGVSVNFNANGKGYAVDAAAEVLLAEGVSDFMIHGGSSSVRASGQRYASGGGPGWQIGVEHPLNPGRSLGHLRLIDRSVGTSGTAKQHFRSGGQRYGHILDPRTGRPAEGMVSVTVTAPTAELADGLSTALFVLGPEAAGRLLAHYPEVSALLVTRRGLGTQVHVAAHRWPPGVFEPAEGIAIDWIDSPEPPAADQDA